MKLRLSVSATIFLLLLARVVLADATVSQGQSIASALASGGKITIADGTYNENLDLGGKSGITLQAANVVTPTLVNVTVEGKTEQRAIGPKVIINGIVKLGGNKASGIIFRGGGNPGMYRGVLQLGTGAVVEDFITEKGIVAGISMQGVGSITLRRFATQDNGLGGWTAGDNNGILMEDFSTLGNNRGISAGSDPFAGHGKMKDGKWFGNTGDEGGGGKIARSKNVKMIRPLAAYNGGIGLWFDWDDSGIEIIDPHAHHNIALFYGWDGQGIDTECDLGVTITNPYTHDNDSVGIQLCEPANVKVVGGHVTDSIHVRTMTSRNHPAHDNSITGVTFYGGADIHYDGGPVWTNSVTSPNTKGAALPVTWKSSGGTTTTPPPPPPDDPALHPVDPGKESAEGASIPPLAVLRDKVTALWAITKSGQIARDGVVMDQTNGVNQLYYINGFVYQRAHDNQYWFYNGAEWKTATLPTTQPNTPPPPTDDPVIKVEPIGGWRITHKSGKTETTP